MPWGLSFLATRHSSLATRDFPPQPIDRQKPVLIPAPGLYAYELISRDQASAWYHSGPRPVSTIGYEQTANALTLIIGHAIAVDRRAIHMEPGDEALVFRLVFPPGSPRIDPGEKGKLADAIMAGHYELGLLRRTVSIAD